MNERKPRILCIDDDPDVIDFLRVVLEGDGCEVISAASGEEGLRAYQDSPPDLVIVDLMMEEIDAGAELVKELRLLGNEAPIYLLSSLGDKLHMTVDTSSLGLAGVFQKPPDRERLLRVVRAKVGTVAAG